MPNQSPEPESSEEFSPKSFIIFCLDETGNVALELSWGEKEEDIKKFAALLNKINTGYFNQMIVDQLKEQSKTQTNGSKNYSIFNKSYKNLNKPKNLVVDPTSVELN
jgi:hypothetical protein